MKPKTPEELREYCQKVADLTGCIVTVNNDGFVVQWEVGIHINSFWLSNRGSWNSYEDEGIYNRHIVILLSNLQIPDPENWLFVPKEEA